MKVVVGLWLLAAGFPVAGFAQEAVACIQEPVTVTGFARTTLGIFAADGTYTDKEISTTGLVAKDIKVCAWNRERNLMRLVFADRDIWVDPAELKVDLQDKPEGDQIVCADAPSRPTGTQSLASMGVGGAECRKKGT